MKKYLLSFCCLLVFYNMGHSTAFITGFTGTQSTSGGHVVAALSWTSLNQNDNCMFLIERSSGGGAYVQVGRVQGAYTNANVINYTWNDDYPPSGTVNYVLKWVSISNVITSGNTIQVSISCGTCQSPSTCSYFISGENDICSSSIYTINSPAARGVTWSLSSTALSSLSVFQCDNSATITRTGTGSVTLNAVVAGCSNTITRTVSLDSSVVFGGHYSTSADEAGDLDPNTYMYVTPYTYVWIFGYGPYYQPYCTLQGGTVTTPTWNVWVGAWEFYISANGWATISLSGTSPGGCSFSSPYYTFMASQGFYRISPSPATTEINIISLDPKSGNPKLVKGVDHPIRKVTILDKFGKAVLQGNYSLGTKQIKLNTNSWKPDMYIARIFDGKTWYSVKFMKK